jgi:predicted Zn-dependent peptidase
MLKGRYVLDREDSMAMGYLAAAELLYRGRVIPMAEQFALIDGVTSDQVAAMASRYLKPAEIRHAVVGPPGLDISDVLTQARGAAA